jgi:hypothetical protein
MRNSLLITFMAIGLLAAVPKFVVAGLEGGLEAKLQKAASNNIDQFELFSFPEDVETQVGLGPTQLERGFWIKLSVRQFQNSNLRPKFLTALSKSSIRPRSSGSRDLRWGCILYDSAGGRACTIYFDRFGDGQIDDAQISSNSALLELFRKELPNYHSKTRN